MTIQICIDAHKGQDCLAFSQMDNGPSKTWRFDKLMSVTKAKSTKSQSFQTSAGSADHGLYYVNQSAHGLMI